MDCPCEKISCCGDSVSGEGWAFSTEDRIGSQWKSFLYFIDTLSNSTAEEDKLSQKRSYI